VASISESPSWPSRPRIGAVNRAGPLRRCPRSPRRLTGRVRGTGARWGCHCVSRHASARPSVLFWARAPVPTSSASRFVPAAETKPPWRLDATVKHSRCNSFLSGKGGNQPEHRCPCYICSLLSLIISSVSPRNIHCHRIRNPLSSNQIPCTYIRAYLCYQSPHPPPNDTVLYALEDFKIESCILYSRAQSAHPARQSCYLLLR
jgi:hypothetical protein